MHVSLLVCNIENAEDDDINNDILADANVRSIDNTIGTNQRPPSFITFDCTEPHCIMHFRREDRLRAHLLIGSHKIIVPPFRLLDKAAMVYKEALDSETPKEIPILSATSSTVTDSTVSATSLEEGWALFRPREKVTFSPTQRYYLNEKYLEGERSGAKWDPSKLAEVNSTRNITYLLHPRIFSSFSICRWLKNRVDSFLNLNNFSLHLK